MKKLLAVFAAIFALVGLAGCSDKTDINAKEEGTNTHAQYVEAAVGDKLTIEAFIQGKQSWWENKATFYLQDGDGGYFAYEVPCTKEEYDNELVEGAKVKITGERAEWAGEIELMYVSEIKVLSGKHIAKAKDITSVYGNTTELMKYQNMKIAVKGFTVVARDSGNAFDYKGDKQGDDIYLSLSDGTNTYAFTLEAYLTDKNSDVYKKAESLKVGDKVDIEGFLYWYNNPEPHVTKITVK